MTYIAFEGGEGSGKSTQAQRLASRLGAVLTREPGGTELGVQLRALLLDPGQAAVEARTETLLMAADRAQHAREVLAPALGQGSHVVSDRSVFSSLAYQGGGRQLGLESVRDINRWALDGYWPELVVLLDIDVAAARTRLERGLDRMEQEDQSFHERVRCTYLELAATDERWIVINADDTPDVVEAAVWSAVQPVLNGASRYS